MIKKDNLVYILGGIVIGMMFGVLISNQSSPRQVVQPVSEQALAPQQQGTQKTEQAFPEGHPPVDNSEILKQLETQKGILAKDPENQEAIIAVANMSSDLKDFPQAILYYEKALKKDPDNVNLITDLATSYFYSQKTDKALELYNRSLKINPKHFQSLMNVGIVKMAVGDKKGAAESWEKVVSYYPESQEAAQLKGVLPQLRQGS